MPAEVPVLIVGGSLNGLTAALCLAHHGVKSLVVERHSSTEEVTRILSAKILPIRFDFRLPECFVNRRNAALRPPESSVGRCIGKPGKQPR
jgi:flavin-dependent dehydrogenase